MRVARFLAFDGWNTAIDGHYTLSALSFDLPDIQEQRQDIAGMDGDLDYTDALAGRPIYKTRPLKAMLSSSFGDREDRLAVFHELVNRVHGKRCAITLPDRPGLTAYGRLTVTLKTDHPAYTEVEINGKCDPFLTDGKALSDTIPELSADTDNLLTDNNVTFMSQYSTCAGRYSALLYKVIVEGDVGSRAVFRISTQPNSLLFVACRVTAGRCAWFVSTDPTAKSGSDGEIKTDSTGYIYLIIRKASVKQCEIGPIVLMTESKMTKINVGASACTGHFTFIRNPGADLTSVILIVNNRLEVYSDFDIDIALQAGINKISSIAFRGGSDGTMHVTYERKTL